MSADRAAGTARGGSATLVAALVLLYVLHNDLWWWDDPSLVLGLPVGLTFHVGLCLAAALVMGLLARRLRPSALEPRDADSADR